MGGEVPNTLEFLGLAVCFRYLVIIINEYYDIVRQSSYRVLEGEREVRV